MTNQERIDELQEAQELLLEAIDAIKAATKLSIVEGYATAYLIPVLEQAISDDNDWISGRNPGNIVALIEQLRGAE